MSGSLALVLPGGGARAAYQVGVLSRIAEEFPELAVPILTGVSAGAINAAFLANSASDFRDTTRRLREVWSGLSLERVLRVQPLSMTWNLGTWGLRLLSGGAHASPSPRGLVDTDPLQRLLYETLDHDDGALRHLPARLASGHLTGLAITTTNYSTGQAVTFIEGKGHQGWRKPYRISQDARLTVDHVLASSAIPLLFPAMRLGRAYHGDGGIRQTAPLAPAVYLGADRILAVSTLRTPSANRPEPDVVRYPPPAQVLGVLVNSIFLDNVDYDAANLERLNTLHRSNRAEATRLGVRPIELLVVRPSEDLGAIASEYEPDLPWMFRYLTRGWGTKETPASDLLATLMFQSSYTQRLIQIGQNDAEQRLGEISAFLSSRPSLPSP